MERDAGRQRLGKGGVQGRGPIGQLLDQSLAALLCALWCCQPGVLGSDQHGAGLAVPTGEAEHQHLSMHASD
eukprot:43477-Eustigmatos_ZCMA.PRE.1